MKNIKIVYLSLGLGIGIILSNILYSVFPQIEYVNLSDEDIIKRAEGLGYVSIKEKISLEKDKTSEKDNIKIEERLVKESVKINILEGDTLKDIAEKLLELKLIENEEEFILNVEEENMDKRFAYGIFEVPVNSNYNQIIDLLTR